MKKANATGAISKSGRLSLMLKGKIIALRGSINQLLNMVLPKIPPVARAIAFRRTATIVATTSGRDVPSANTDSPISVSGMPSSRAKFCPPATTCSAPASIRAKPPMASSTPCRRLGKASGNFSFFFFCSPASFMAAYAYIANGISNIPPSVEGISARRENSARLMRASPAAIECSLDGCRASCCLVICDNRTISPPMSHTFAMLLPRIFPIAKPSLPANAACRDRNSSGAEVPNPTIATPAKAGDHPNRLAMLRLPCTVASPPNTSMISPKASIAIE